MAPRGLQDAPAARRFLVFAQYFEPDPWQADVLRSSASRLALNCSRQVGKSTAASIVALHRAVDHPGSLILLVSPSLRQSRTLFGKVSDFMRALDVKLELDEDNSLAMKFVNRSRVVCLPENAATVRGYSAADLIVDDESAYVMDELYRSMRPMLAVSGGRLIPLSTPYGKRGHFFEEWQRRGEDWERISVTADDCPRIDKTFLEQERESPGERWFRQEYYCEFVETLDQVFRYEDIMGSFTDAIEPLFTGDQGEGIRPLFEDLA